MQNKVKELNNVITQNPPDMKKLQLVLQGSVSVQVWNTFARNKVRNMECNITNTRDRVSSDIQTPIREYILPNSRC